MDFREFLTEQEKPWKAKRAEIIRHWSDLRPDMPLRVEPIATMHKGTRYHSDGLRITGTSQFINSVLSRIKDMLHYENPHTEVDVEYQQITSKTKDAFEVPKFVCYVHVIERELKIPKISKIPKIPKPKKPKKPKKF